MEQHQGVTSLLKSLAILDCFQNDSQQLGISDIAAMVDMPSSSVHRIIQQLKRGGLLTRDVSTRKYFIGSKLLSYSQKCERYNHFLSVAARAADQLGELTGESVNVSICSDDQLTHLYIKPSRHILRPSFLLNKPYPAHNTSGGRVFLSELSDAELKTIYKNNQQDISMSLEAFLEMLHRIREDGYALDDESFNPGLRCVAAPIRLFSGTLIFTISISSPISRMNDELYEKTRLLVLQQAALISQELHALES